jgi:hypothetical protein
MAEFDAYGMADAERIYNSALEVRCPECGRRYRANVERKPDSKGLHRVRATCPCGRVRAEGSVQMCFFREVAS